MSAPVERSQGSTNGHPRHANGAGNGWSSAIAGNTRGDAACVRELADGARIVAGNAGDHPLVLQLLVETRQGALADDFQSRLDEPTYRPSDRLLVRRDRSLVAHVHVASHIGWFDSQRVPLVKLEDFAALPEFAQAGYGEQLLAAAENIAASEGALLGLVHSEAPDVFVRHGWSLLRGQGHTRAGARAVLAHLDAQDAARRKRRKAPLEIRTWRHFEMDAIRKVYDETAAGLWGPLLRSEAAWQWLIGRKAQDQILLAVDARDASPDDSASDLLKAGGRVVGYAVVRGSCIVEMMTLADFPSARTQLLARACHDAMDRGHHSTSLYTPAADSLHELLVTAGGAWISDASAGDPRWLIKLLAPEKWVERFYAAWHDRARAAEVPRPFEMGFVVGGETWRFTLTRRSSRLERVDERPNSWVECDRAVMESLLLGNLSVAAAVTHGRLRPSRPEIAGELAALFTPRLFWQSQLEVMRL
jgi:GNAT superfamily N-acetyltransferase